MLRGFLGGDFTFELRGQPGLLLGGEPTGLRRPVGEIEPGHDAEQNGRNALDDEKPLPAFQSERAVESEQEVGDRRTDHGGNRDGDGEGGEKAGAIFRRVPIGQIENDARKETGFRHAEQKAHCVEAPDPADDRHQCGDDTPGHHDPRDPAAGAEFFERQIARHLEDEIADEEDAGAPCEHRRREFQLGIHGQRGEAEIDAIEIGKEIRQHQERNQPPRDRADRRGFEFALSGAGRGYGGGGHQFLPVFFFWRLEGPFLALRAWGAIANGSHECAPDDKLTYCGAMGEDGGWRFTGSPCALTFLSSIDRWYAEVDSRSIEARTDFWSQVDNPRLHLPVNYYIWSRLAHIWARPRATSRYR